MRVPCLALILLSAACFQLPAATPRRIPAAVAVMAADGGDSNDGWGTDDDWSEFGDESSFGGWGFLRCVHVLLGPKTAPKHTWIPF